MSDLFKSTYNPDALSCITTRRRLEGRGRAQSAPESGGGFPGGVYPVGPSPKVPGRLAGGFRVRRGLRRHRPPPGAASHSSASPAVQREFRRHRTPPGRHHLSSAAVADYKKGGVCTPPSSRDPKTKPAQSRTIKQGLLRPHVCHDNTTLRILSLRMGHDFLIVNEGKVYDPALIGIHGSKANLPPLPDRTRCRRTCKRNEFLLTTHLVSLYVNHNGIMEVYRVAHIGVDEHL